MKVEQARDICQIVAGEQPDSGLSTICLALIHVAFCNGYTKQDALEAMAGQWDLYADRQRRNAN